MAGLLLNGFNIGQDISVSFNSDTGITFSADQLGHLMSFDAEIIDKEVDCTPISNYGKPLYDIIYQGWRGRLGFTRVNGNLTGLFIQLSNQFFSAGVRTHFNIQCSVVNRDGTIDQVMFTACSLSKGNFGDFKANKEVEQSFSFRAQNLTATDNVNKILGGAGLQV